MGRLKDWGALRAAKVQTKFNFCVKFYIHFQSVIWREKCFFPGYLARARARARARPALASALGLRPLSTKRSKYLFRGRANVFFQLCFDVNVYDKYIFITFYSNEMNEILYIIVIFFQFLKEKLIEFRLQFRAPPSFGRPIWARR